VRWRSILLWILYPLGYGLMVELRAVVVPAAPVRYPYFFLNPTDKGYGWVAGQFLYLFVVFAILGAAVVGLDRLAALGSRRGTAAGAPEPLPASESSPEASPAR